MHTPARSISIERACVLRSVQFLLNALAFYRRDAAVAAAHKFGCTHKIAAALHINLTEQSSNSHHTEYEEQ